MKSESEKIEPLEESTNPQLTKDHELYREGEVTLTRVSGFSTEVVELLDSTTWGTADTLYEHKKTDERIKDLTDPIPIELRVGDKLAALVVLDGRPVINKGFICNSYFFRYLASDVNFRGRKIVGKFGRICMDTIRDGEQGKAIYFNSVEAKNYRSFNFVRKVGYEPIARIKTSGFSRFFTSSDKRVNRLPVERQGEMTDLLKQMYSGHSLVHFSNIYKNDGYFVFEEDGEIIAGVQAHPATWVVKKLGSKREQVLLKVVPHIPVLRKVFNPRKFEFLAFEGIYYQEGRERVLLRLFESVLHHYKRHSALFWLDENCPYYQNILEHGRLGILQNFVKGSDTWFMASSRNLSAEEEEMVTSGPAYVSAFDFI